MRILILHGFTQNANIVKSKFSNTIKLINQLVKNIEWVVPDASNIIDEKNNLRAWYYCNADDPLDYAKYFDVECSAWYGLDKTLEYFKSINNRFDVIIGFSQGAQLAHYLLYNNIITTQKVVFISGFVFPWNDLYQNKISNVESLHVYGLADNIVSNGKTKFLINQYQNKTIIEHTKHHILGFNNSICKDIANWICRNYKEI